MTASVVKIVTFRHKRHDVPEIYRMTVMSLCDMRIRWYGEDGHTQDCASSPW